MERQTSRLRHVQMPHSQHTDNDDFITPELLFHRHRDVLYGATPDTQNGHRMVLQIDPSGQTSYKEVTRADIIKLVVEKAAAVKKKDPNPVSQSQIEPGFVTPPVSPAGMLPRSGVGRRRNVSGITADIPSVHMRDIRKLDNAFSITNEPSITVRKQAILVNADPLRAVITVDVALVFLPDGADSLISLLRESFNETLGEDHQGVAFELRALEALLHTISKIFAKDCDKVLPLASAVMDRIALGNMGAHELETLRMLKNTINELHAQVANLRRMLMEIVENEQIIRQLYLSKLLQNPHLQYDIYNFDAEYAETLMETYLQDVYSTQTRVALMLNSIQNTQSIQRMKLDSMRNYLLTVDLSITLFTVLTGVPTFITGCCGMNIDSGVWSVDYAFYIVFGLCIAFPLICFQWADCFFKRRGISLKWYTSKA